MTAALADAALPTETPNPPALQEPPAADPIMDEVRIGIDRLREMAPDELRAVIATRVEMLQTVLRERAHRREAIRTARLAARIYDIRHQRSRRIHRRVNVGSAVAAVLGTCLIVAVMV